MCSSSYVKYKLKHSERYAKPLIGSDLIGLVSTDGLKSDMLSADRFSADRLRTRGSIYVIS